MTEPFLMHLKTKEERTVFINIRDKHHEEATKCISILNNFIKNVLHIDTISVQLIYYDDLLKEVDTSPSFSSLSERYFLDGKYS